VIRYFVDVMESHVFWLHRRYNDVLDEDHQQTIYLVSSLFELFTVASSCLVFL